MDEVKLSRLQGEKLLLVRFYWDAGRGGHVTGLFVTTDIDLENLYGKEIRFGEILGKHSEVYGIAEKGDFRIVSEDQDFIVKLIDVIGSCDISGYNPQNYLPEEDWVEEEEED